MNGYKESKESRKGKEGRKIIGQKETSEANSQEGIEQ